MPLLTPIHHPRPPPSLGAAASPLRRPRIRLKQLGFYPINPVREGEIYTFAGQIGFDRRLKLQVSPFRIWFQISVKKRFRCEITLRRKTRGTVKRMTTVLKLGFGWERMSSFFLLLPPPPDEIFENGGFNVRRRVLMSEGRFQSTGLKRK
ncbi:uncharacterized protein LOC121763058 [Salvia splendens]|uniref:uncharacterized protein LOC121763058 n=1 Tax=Salvia splendens TaxID=180675 RepID=UPI001C27E337|nr:uncharacterized protein LOC121763058 [Salvia splendens]